VKVLATLAAVIAFGSQSSDVSFKQTQGDDGLFRAEIGVHYGFPGLPPRTTNSGVGTVRVTLPDASVTVESVDAGYQCATEGPGTVLCSSVGQPQDDGTAFPPSMTLHLISQSCLTSPGTADVWASPKDPGGSPDVSFALQPSGCDTTDPSTPPVLDTKETCKVPNVKGMTVAAATRELTAGDCLKGKVGFAYSKKVKKGRVITQSQRPGKTLKFRSKVNLIVSKGKKNQADR
jgi:PASTA domain